MSVYRRGDVWHYDFTIGQERFRGSTQQRGKAAALRVESLKRERAALGEVSRPVPTLREASYRWFAAKIEGKRSAATTAQRLEIALRLIGRETPVTAIDTPDIADAMQRRRLEPTRQKRLPTNSTVNRDLIDTTLRPVLNYCRRVMKVRELQEIDWRELRLTEPKERSRAFTLAEMRAWRAALPEHHRQVFDFIATFGVRLSEAFFPPAAFDPASGIITIRQRKNGKPHIVRLTPDESDDLTERWRFATANGFATLWYREATGKLVPLTSRGFQNASQRALGALAMADARPVHDLRHHAATALLRLPGASLRHVQAFLGHESITSTARYAHVTHDDVYNIRRHASGTSAPSPGDGPNENKTLPTGRTGT